MITEVVMPQMGADMKEGTIINWRKAEGDEVNRGEIIAEIETDKANIEIEAFGAGVFRKAIHKDGETVPVGTIIAVIAAPSDDIAKYEGGGAAPAPAAEAQAPAPESAPAPSAPAPEPVGAAPVPSAPPATTAAQAAPAAPARADGRLRASPVARRMAEEFGIDLATVNGTGPDGRIVRRDVEAARTAAPAQAATATATMTRAAPAGVDEIENIPLSRMRQTIARRTQESKQNVPHYYLGADIDMTELMALRSSVNKALGDRGRISVNDIVILATARTLVQHPKFNAFWAEDHIERHSQVNVGIAVALDDGLVAPAVIDTANKGLEQISIEARDVAQRARSGSLKPEEYTAATFNVSNVGGFGIDTISAIITQPQVGVLGVGAVKETPVIRDGQVVVRQMMNVILSADHRATDGADGARFLQTLRQLLESPGMMLL
ncbi:MAG: dihydrolipoamide acetyltransferase [Dehalococcoidia bacterium]|nr:dihydrolipoamide acetyltransferase [Dehalococcoidia bacterium]